MGGEPRDGTGTGGEGNIPGVNGGENQGMERVRVAGNISGVNRGDVKSQYRIGRRSCVRYD